MFLVTKEKTLRRENRSEREGKKTKKKKPESLRRRIINRLSEVEISSRTGRPSLPGPKATLRCQVIARVSLAISSLHPPKASSL